jgi:predicted metal-binding protein
MKSARSAPDRLKSFLKRIVELGADEAKVVKTESVETAAWVRLKCQYGCDGYGSSLCCPPNTPSHWETQKIIDGYELGLLAHFGMNGSATKAMVILEREAFLQGYYKAFAFGAGPCTLCKSCHVEGCKHPDRARPSMEACGIDVFATARRNDYPIHVVGEQHSEQNYYGLLLVE